MNISQTLEFRPRTIGELLDQSIRLYRNNFLTFVVYDRIDDISSYEDGLIPEKIL
jgi:hypothetical protein